MYPFTKLLQLQTKAANCLIELVRNCSSGGWFVFQREKPNQSKIRNSLFAFQKVAAVFRASRLAMILANSSPVYKKLSNLSTCILMPANLDFIWTLCCKSITKGIWQSSSNNWQAPKLIFTLSTGVVSMAIQWPRDPGFDSCYHQILFRDKLLFYFNVDKEHKCAINSCILQILSCYKYGTGPKYL